jgi:hypothetical protein
VHINRKGNVFTNGFFADVTCLLIKGNNVDSTNMNTVSHWNMKNNIVIRGHVADKENGRQPACPGEGKMCKEEHE